MASFNKKTTDVQKQTRGKCDFVTIITNRYVNFYLKGMTVRIIKFLIKQTAHKAGTAAWGVGVAIKTWQLVIGTASMELLGMGCLTNVFLCRAAVGLMAHTQMFPEMWWHVKSVILIRGSIAVVGEPKLKWRNVLRGITCTGYWRGIITMVGIAVALQVLVSFIDNCVNSQNKNIVFNVFFDASNLPKFNEIERHILRLGDYKSKNRCDKIIALRICSSFLVHN